MLFSLHLFFVFKKYLKIFSQGVFLLKGTEEKHKQTLEVDRNHPLTNLQFQRYTAAAPVDALSLQSRKCIRTNVFSKKTNVIHQSYSVFLVVKLECYESYN